MSLERAPYGPQDIHPYGCDCVNCWVGVTINAPRPPSLWQRFIAALRSRSTPQDGGRNA